MNVDSNLFDVLFDLGAQPGEVTPDSFLVSVEPLELTLRRRGARRTLLLFLSWRTLKRELVLVCTEKNGSLRNKLVTKLFEEDVLNQVLCEMIKSALLVC